VGDGRRRSCSERRARGARCERFVRGRERRIEIKRESERERET